MGKSPSVRRLGSARNGMAPTGLPRPRWHRSGSFRMGHNRARNRIIKVRPTPRAQAGSHSRHPPPRKLSDDYVDSRTTPVLIGVDVGPTTVKAAVVDPEILEIFLCDYQRHQTKQPEKVLEFMVRIGSIFPKVEQQDMRVSSPGRVRDPLPNTLVRSSCKRSTAPPWLLRNSSPMRAA